MKGKQKSVDWKFWFQWVLYNTLGYGLGGVLGWFIAYCGAIFSLYFSATEEAWLLALGVAMALGGAIAGMSVGLAQWRAVRVKTLYTGERTWMMVNILGMAVSWIVAFWMNFPEEPANYHMAFTLLTAGALWGLLSAANLWHTLREQMQHAAIWFVVTTLCGTFVIAIGWIWTWVPIEHSRFTSDYAYLEYLVFGIKVSIISWPIAGLLYGLITGTLLVKLLPESSQPDGTEYALAK